MDARDILTRLKGIPMFRDMDPDGEKELLRLVPYVRSRTYAAGERLLSEDRIPDKTVIVLKGRAHVRRPADRTPDQREPEERGPGAILGRTSLEADAFERITVVAAEEMETLVLPFRDLVRAYQNSDYLREHLASPLKPDVLVRTLQSLRLFHKFTDRVGELELYQVARIVGEQVYGHGEWVFRQGEISDRLITILEGQIKLIRMEPDGLSRDLDTYGPGTGMGETGLLVGDFHDVTAVAEGYARVLTITRPEFEALLETRPYLGRKLSIPESVEKRRQLRQFNWLRSDEWVVTVAQRHWSRLLRQVAIPLLIVLLLLLAITTLLANGSGVLGAILILITALIFTFGVLWQYMNWRDDYFVVTTQRVVHIERVWPLSLHQEETPLDNIEDIYEAQPGLSANLMGYGNLVLQTAGETVDIDMSYVPEPDQLRLLISEQIERTRARDILRTRGQVRELLAHRLQTGELPAEDNRMTSQGVADGSDTSQPFLPWVLLTSVWEYMFPPSKVETDGGNTILWRRFWLPGMFRHSPVFMLFVVATVGGPWYLSTLDKNSALTGWLVTWLFVEAVLFGVLFWFIENWRNDYFQLTATHIILVERQPLLMRESRHEARLDRIQNLSYEIPSLFARVFGYGHVQFETAGTQGKFVLQCVRRPETVQATISDRQYQYRQRQRQIEASRRQQELLTWFSTYDELHREIGAS